MAGSATNLLEPFGRSARAFGICHAASPGFKLSRIPSWRRSAPSALYLAPLRLPGAHLVDEGREQIQALDRGSFSSPCAPGTIGRRPQTTSDVGTTFSAALEGSPTGEMIGKVSRAMRASRSSAKFLTWSRANVALPRLRIHIVVRRQLGTQQAGPIRDGGRPRWGTDQRLLAQPGRAPLVRAV